MAGTSHSNSKQGSPSRAAGPTAADADARQLPASVQWLLPLGVGLLFVGACCYGVLEVHSSTDTWIGLAAGRQIAERGLGDFPRHDTFSYTSGGGVWYNQNWLSHLFFWLLYDHLGRDAVVFGTWLVNFGTFTFVLLATRLRCGSWLAAALAAALVAISCRDWVSIRPATIQFFCLALTWLALSGLIARPRRAGWWPFAVLGAVLLVWPHAHGSFVFGYAMIGMFVIAALAGLLLQRRMTIRVRELWVLLAIVAVTGILGAVLSPYGWENYLHQSKVAESKAFRTVGEWLPPYVTGKFPPVLRFWLAVTVAAASVLGAAVLRIWSLGTAAPVAPGVPAARARVHVVLFDVGAVVLGFSMAIFARRFAPIFYILVTPALVTWIFQLARATPALRQDLRQAFGLAAWPALVVTLFVTVRNARSELATTVPGQWDLLDRVTQNMRTPHDIFAWLNRNEIKPRVMTEWKVAGVMMFYVPGAQVFIDGRAQQVYSERQYNTYLWLQGPAPAQAATVTALLLNAGTEAVLLPSYSSTRRLQDVIESQPEWQLVFESNTGALWVHRTTTLARSLAERETRGELWWPDEARLLTIRGALLTGVPGADLSRSLALWQEAVRRDLRQGLAAYPLLAQTWKAQGQRDVAAAYLAGQRGLVAGIGEAKLRDQLLATIQRCEEFLAGRGTAPSAAPER